MVHRHAAGLWRLRQERLAVRQQTRDLERVSRVDLASQVSRQRNDANRGRALKPDRVLIL